MVDAIGINDQTWNHAFVQYLRKARRHCDRLSGGGGADSLGRLCVAGRYLLDIPRHGDHRHRLVVSSRHYSSSIKVSDAGRNFHNLHSRNP